MQRADFDKIIKKIKNGQNQSYIISVDKQSLINQFVISFKKQLAIHPSDLLVIESEAEESLKISQIRRIRQKLALKPQGSVNLVCLIGAENLTLEAANSLLKILEEPPPQSFIILFTKNKQKLLPTITSRCIEIIIRDLIKEVNAEHAKILVNFLQPEKIYQKFKLVDEVVNLKINIRKMLTDWLYYLRKHPEVYHNTEVSKTIYKYLRRYSPKINQKLFLENLILSIVKKS